MKKVIALSLLLMSFSVLGFADQEKKSAAQSMGDSISGFAGHINPANWSWFKEQEKKYNERKAAGKTQ